MAKVTIRKEDLDRVLQVAERTAKRTNERVVIALERVEVRDTVHAAYDVGGAAGNLVNFG